MALGFFAAEQSAVRKEKPNLTNLIWPNLTKTNIFSNGELSHGKKSVHVDKYRGGPSDPFFETSVPVYNKIGPSVPVQFTKKTKDSFGSRFSVFVCLNKTM